MKNPENCSKKTVAIIPARKGSVGIPGKNYILLDGNPLIEYTIIEAIKSNLIDDIIVSTNCPEVISICHEYIDRLTVLVRPDDLAQNDSKTEDVVAHACNYYIKTNALIGKIILLQPTSPIRFATQIDESLKLFEASGKMTLISVTEPIQHPYDFVVEKNGIIDYMCRKEDVFRRQDFGEAWFMNGAIYISDYIYFKENKKIYDLKDCLLYKMPIESSVDIDTPFDLEVCNSIIMKIKEKNHE